MVFRKDWGQPQQGLEGFARTMKAYGRKVNLSSADVSTTGNVVGAFILPANFVAMGLSGLAPAFGAGLVLNIGDAALNNRFLAASTIGAAGGAFTAIASTGLFFKTLADTEVQIQIGTQTTAAGVAGVLEFYLFGFAL